MIELCEQENLAGLNRSPLGMGLLTGKFTPSATFGADDQRSAASWHPGFAEGRPAEAWLNKLAAVRDILTSDGRTLAQGALAWIWGRSRQTIPIPGFKTVAQVEENCGSSRCRAAEPSPDGSCGGGDQQVIDRQSCSATRSGPSRTPMPCPWVRWTWPPRNWPARKRAVQLDDRVEDPASQHLVADDRDLPFDPALPVGRQAARTSMVKPQWSANAAASGCGGTAAPGATRRFTTVLVRS